MGDVFDVGQDGDDDALGRSIASVGPQTRVDPLAMRRGNVEARGVKREGWVRIILEDSENIPPTGQPFGINGDTYIVRPGEEVDVPPGIISVLNDAKVTVPVLDPNTLQVVGWRNRLRFPYHRV